MYGLPSNKHIFDALEKSKFEEVKNEIVEEFNQKCGLGVEDPKTWELVVIIAQKLWENQTLIDTKKF